MKRRSRKSMREMFIAKDKSMLTRVIECLNSLEFDLAWQIEIKPYQKNRSNAQNRLYWMWIDIIGNECGYSKEEMHAILAMEFLEPVEIEYNGNMIIIPRSTKRLKTNEFTEYLNAIEVFAGAELGLALPHPHVLYYESMGIAELA